MSTDHFRNVDVSLVCLSEKQKISSLVDIKMPIFEAEKPDNKKIYIDPVGNVHKSLKMHRSHLRFH